MSAKWQRRRRISPFANAACREVLRRGHGNPMECATLWEEAAFRTHEMNEEQHEKLKHLRAALLASLKKNTKFFRRLALRFFVVRY